MTSKDAAMFPIIASCTLLGLYIFFKIFSKEYINLLLTLYFFGLGVLAVTHLLRPNVELVLPASFPNKNYTLDLIEGKGEKKSGNCINYLCITQLVCVPWLMKIVSCILLYSLLNSKVSLNWNLSPLFELMDITDIVLTLFSQSVLLKLQTKFSH